MTENTVGIAKSTTSVVVHEIYRILAENIAPKLIKLPIEKADVEKNSSKFLERFGFPQVIGCIDGTTYSYKTAARKLPRLFFLQNVLLNKLSGHQAICDAHGQFINLEIQWPSSVHDASVFANCLVQKNYSTGKFKLFYKELSDGRECVPQLLLGDSAYPLLPYVMISKRSEIILR